LIYEEELSDSEAKF